MPAPRLNVAELRAANRTSGEEFEAVLILRRISTRTARNDNAYLAVELGDKTGSFSANVFADSPINEALRGAGEGAVVWVSAKIEFYQGRLSPRPGRVTVVPESDLVAQLDAHRLERFAGLEDQRAARVDIVAAAGGGVAGVIGDRDNARRRGVEEVAAALTGELRLLAGWLGLDEVTSEPLGTLAPALSDALGRD